MATRGAERCQHAMNVAREVAQDLLRVAQLGGDAECSVAVFGCLFEASCRLATLLERIREGQAVGEQAVLLSLHVLGVLSAALKGRGDGTGTQAEGERESIREVLEGVVDAACADAIASIQPHREQDGEVVVGGGDTANERVQSRLVSAISLLLLE